MGGFPRASISLGFSFSDEAETAARVTPPATHSRRIVTGSNDVHEEYIQLTTSSCCHRNAPSLAVLPAHNSAVDGPHNKINSELASTHTAYDKIYLHDTALAPNLVGHLNDNTGLGFATTKGIDEQGEAAEEDNDEDDDNSLLIDDSRRVRQDGKAFEKQRKISHELDTIDKIIVNLKRQNFPNDQIARQLREHGLCSYDPKTVGTRFIRVEKKIEDHEAQRIEDGLTDWHDGEDEALIQADELAQAEIRDVIKRAKARRWQLVARNLQKFLKKELKYGPKACEKRFTDLMNDCASIPIELDDNPDARRVERAVRVVQKLEELAEVVNREANAKEKKTQANQDAELQKLISRTARAKKQAACHEIKAEKARTKLEEQSKKQQRLEQQRRTEKAKFDRAAKKYAEDNGLAYTAPSSSIPTGMLTTPVAAPFTTPKASSSSVVSKRKRASVVVDITESPRHRMSCKELGTLLGIRNLTKGGTKEEQIKRLEADDQRTAMRDLQEKCRGQGLSTEGTRDQLIGRIVAEEVGQSIWGRKHIPGLEVGRSMTLDKMPTKNNDQEDGASNTDEPLAKRLNLGGSFRGCRLQGSWSRAS